MMFQMQYDRATHLADLNRDIQNWQADVKRLEIEGYTSRANEVRRWIKSAQHFADLLRHMPNNQRLRD